MIGVIRGGATLYNGDRFRSGYRFGGYKLIIEGSTIGFRVGV